jgi:uncharacterized protein YlbG (UPF0298 family)
VIIWYIILRNKGDYMVKRKGIVVYFRSNKVLKKLSQYKINITYVNKLGKYLTGYVDENDYEKIEKSLKKMRLIKYVESSLVDMDELSFTG